MKLTNHQDEKKGETVLHLKTARRAVLQGNAGTGKTTLADQIIRELPGKTVCLAPTNKAVSVIQDKVISTNNFMTVHKALQMRMSYQGKKKMFVPMEGKKKIFAGIRNIVIDESSMIGEELLGYIEEYAERQYCRILYIGDEKQLNPVKEKHSPVFHQGFPTITLEQIIRQGEGNPIIDLSLDLDQVWKRQNRRNDIGGYIYSNEQQKVVDTLAEVNGTDALKYLAWQNTAVNDMNNLVRGRIYGRPNRVELGETLIFDSPYMNDNDSLAYYTNEEMKVEYLSIENEEFSFPMTSSFITEESVEQVAQLKVYKVNPGERGLRNGVIVIHEDSEREYKKLMWAMSTNCKNKKLEYRDKDKALAKFADVKYNHAITVHKSQGSTYEKTILDVGDMSFNSNIPEKKRLFYTGITRASELLILYNM